MKENSWFWSTCLAQGLHRDILTRRWLCLCLRLEHAVGTEIIPSPLTLGASEIGLMIPGVGGPKLPSLLSGERLQVSGQETPEDTLISACSVTWNRETEDPRATKSALHSPERHQSEGGQAPVEWFKLFQTQGN